MSQRLWQKTPCTIVSSEIRERNNRNSPFAFTVSYEFTQGGRSRTASTYQRNYWASSRYSEAQQLVREYPAGGQAFCYVNPKNPAEVVLKQNSFALGLAFPLPLLFVLIGAGGIYGTWTKRPFGSAPALANVAIHSGGKRKYGVVALLALFAVAGGAILYPLGIKPIAHTIAARSWVPTPCKVLQAEVRSHSGDKGTTYSIYVLYQYAFNGQTYKADQYSFVGGSSSGYQSKAQVVEQYRTAANPVCYVNPHDPAQAVLRRGFQAGLLVVFMPLAFLAIGLGGIYGVLRYKAKPVLPKAPAVHVADDGLVMLRPRYSPLMKLIGAVLIAIVFNIVNGLLLSQLASGHQRGHLNWILILFLVPFGAVGLGMLAFVGYRFLALFNPRPTLELSTNVIPLGGAAELRWSFSGRTSRIDEFTVTLRGVEETKYQKGTHTYTDHNTFYEMELYRTSEASEIAAGQVGFVVPPDTMHSFEAQNNKILWNLDIHGSIKHWPDVKESFRITVTPATV